MENYIDTTVTIGEDCILGKNSVIHADTTIGTGVRIDDTVILGKTPLVSKNSATTTTEELQPLIIGNNVLIGSGVTIYRGTKIGDGCLIGDNAVIREHVTIGENTIIGSSTKVDNRVTIGSHCKIQSNVHLVPYSTIEDCVFIGPGVLTSNDAFVGRTKERLSKFSGAVMKRGSRIGVGAILLPGITIHEDALVGAGSVVTHDIPSRQVFVGNPARYLKDVPMEQLLENQ